MRIPRWIYFYLIAFLTEGAMLCMMLAEPIYALRHFHATPLQLGILGTAGGGSYALVALLAGWMSDRTDRRTWILYGAAVQVAAGVLLPFCPNLTSFIVLAALHTAMMGCFWAPLMGLFSETTPHHLLSRRIGRWNISWSSGSVFGLLLSGYLYDHLSPVAPFLAGAAVMAGVTAVVASSRPHGRRIAREEHPPRHPRGRYFMHQAWLLLVSNFFVASLLLYIFPQMAQSPPFALSAEAIGQLHGLRQAVMMLTFALMGATVHWHFRHLPLHACYGVIVLMMVVTALIRWEWAFVLPFAAFGVATGVAYGLSVYYSMLSPEANGVAIGIHEMLLSLGGTIGPIFGGAMISLSGRTTMPFWAGIAPLALVWAAAVLYQRRKVPTLARQP